MSLLPNPYEAILQKCNELDISISQLCKKAKVGRATIEKWKDNPPKTVRILARIEEAIKKLEG
jgi:predicted transcriptional regulator